MTSLPQWLYRLTLPVLVLSGALLLGGCAGKKKLVELPVTTPDVPESDAAILDKLAATDVPYEWFAGYGQGKIDWEGQRFSATFRVRMLRDSVIWLQIQKLGFEVGRMLITRDSAYVINRFERFYSVYDTREFCREYNLPADFEMFGKVFTAGAYIPADVRETRAERDGSLHVSSHHGMQASYWFDPVATLSRSVVQDHLNREWMAGYADYRSLGAGRNFPYKRSNTVAIDGVAHIMDLEYKEVEIDVPQEFPFSIPSHYEKI